jgi:hypothetical protein
MLGFDNLNNRDPALAPKYFQNVILLIRIYTKFKYQLIRMNGY